MTRPSTTDLYEQEHEFIAFEFPIIGMTKNENNEKERSREAMHGYAGRNRKSGQLMQLDWIQMGDLLICHRLRL